MRKCDVNVLAVVLASVIVLPVAARGQTIVADSIQVGPRAATTTGTAVIRGRVNAADTGRPLRRAQVTVTSADQSGVRRSISTSADGRYEVADLPAGRYTIAAWRSGYLTLRYGQSRPLEAGRPLQILDKQIVEKLDFTLTRMSVLGGRVTDEAGEPIAGARVLVMRQAYVDGARRLGVVDHGTTDDAGRYRIVNLAPGAYFVLATLWQTWTIIERDVEQTIGYAPTYYPGTSSVQNARRISLGVGQSIDTADFSMVRAAVASVSGTRSIRGAGLSSEKPSACRRRFPTRAPTPRFSTAARWSQADGTFTIKNVPPGDYKLVIRYVVRDGSGAHVEEAGTAPCGGERRRCRRREVRDLARRHGRRSVADGPRDRARYSPQPRQDCRSAAGRRRRPQGRRHRRQRRRAGRRDASTWAVSSAAPGFVRLFPKGGC